MTFRGTKPEHQWRNQQILTMHQFGCSRREIANRFGLKSDHVHRICRVLLARGPGYGPDEKADRNDEIRLLRRRGRTLESLAWKYRVSKKRIREITEYDPQRIGW